ncbi:MAG: glycosyltransferase family 4 protein [Lachnospiraceae bacterium]|nr:glycosyltransferase family 4 protein [Lachnospiraceae bacterium]
MNSRLLLFMSEYVWGGAETQLRHLLQYYETNGYEVDVIIEHIGGFEDDKHLVQARSEMKYVHFFEFYEKGVGVERRQHNIDSFLKAHSRKVDYYAALLFYEADLVRVDIIRSYGIPVVYSERVDGTVVFKSERLIEYMKKCDSLTCNSSWAKQRIEEKIHRKVEVIHNGKCVKDISNKRRSRKIKNILVPSRLTVHKNQKFVLEWLQKAPAFDGTVVFAGKTDNKDYFRRLYGMVNSGNLKEHVKFYGHVENMDDLYEWSDLVILPSTREGTPNVILESFLVGRPAIVSDIGPEQEIVRDKRFRFGLEDAGNIQKCIEAVENLDDKSYYEMIDHNRELVINEYNIDRMASSFYRLLKSLDKPNAVIDGKSELLNWQKEMPAEPDDSALKRKSIISELLNHWLWLKQNDISISAYFHNRGYRTVAVYGLGILGERLLDEMQKFGIEVSYIIDRNADSRNSDIPIFKDIQEGMIVDAVVVTVAINYEKVFEQLHKLTAAPIIWIGDVIYSAELMSLDRSPF